MLTKLRTTRELKGEMPRLTEDATLNRAFQLAHSIYRYRERDRTISLEILWEALRGVEVRLTAQDEADRHIPRNPTKARWNVAQWFQLLIYCKSERYEKEQEADNKISLGDEDMFIRYLKHLTFITCRRNSFYTTLGFSRLLYNYSVAETIAIYDLVFQDLDNSTKKADAYYRDRKNKLIEELKKRFQQFVRIDQGPRGEKRFQTHHNSGQFLELVIQNLRGFTPWETRCELPEKLDAWTPIHSLRSRQMSQIHSIIHPACFSRITKSLNLDPPESRLALPRICLTDGWGDGASPPGESPPPSGLTPEEAAALRSRLADQEGRRKRFSPRSLSILVDGIERVRLDLIESTQVRFDVEEEITLIELMGHNEHDELLLATHILTYEEDDPPGEQPETYSVVLEGGQKISLVISPVRNDAGVNRSSIEVRYQETNWMKAAALWWQQLRHRQSTSKNLKRWWEIPIQTTALVLALLAVIAIGCILYLTLRSGPTETEQIARQQPHSSIVEESKHTSQPVTPVRESPPQTTPTTEPTRSTSTTKTEPLKRAPGVSGTPSGIAPQTSVTTRDQRDRTVKSLLEMKHVYVDSLGADVFSQAVRRKLIEKLQANSRFIVTKGPDEADTALMGSARQEGRQRDENTGQEIDVGNVSLELLNVAGDVVWRARKYQGAAEQIAAQFTKDLLEAIQSEEQRLKEKK